MTRRHDSKISAIFWGIILIFPIIWFVFSFIAYVQPFSDSSVSISLEDLDLFLTEFISNNLVITVITQPLVEFFTIFLVPGTFIADSFALVFFFIIYYIFIHIFRLAADVILFIPHLFHSWITKFDRKVE